MANLNHAEFAKKYTSTYTLVTINTLNLNRVSANFKDIYVNDVGKYMCLLETTIGEVLAPLVEIKVEETPNRQMFDLLGRSFEFCRLPERQWQKGLGRSNCIINDPILNLLNITPPEGVPNLEFPLVMSNYQSRTIPVSLEVIDKLFETYERRSLNQAMEYLDHTEALSVCLDKKYVLALHPTMSDKYVILRYSVPIGITNREGKYTVLLPIFKQEVEDLHVKYFN